MVTATGQCILGALGGQARAPKKMTVTRLSGRALLRYFHSVKISTLDKQISQ